jgi:hypothetical protein
MSDVTKRETVDEEVERLRAENAALTRRVARRMRLRSAAAWSLLVLGCLLAVLSLVAVWLRVTLLDTDRYVDTVAPIAAEPGVQQAVADKLETAIYSRIDFAALARDVLPDRADVLAPAIQAGVERVVSDRIAEFTRSQRFQDLWVDANRRAHTRVVELLTGGRSGRLELDEDTVYLDLSAAVERVRSGLQERGLDRIANAIPSSVDGRVKLFQSQELVTAQRAVKLLKAVAIVLPVLALGCLVGAVFLTRSRRRGLLRVGMGLAVAMLLLIAALAVARSAYLDALDQTALPRAAASNVFDTVVALLRDGVRVAVIVAVLVAVLSYVAGLPLQRLLASFVTSSRRRWIAAHRTALMLGVGGVGAFVLLVWSPLTGGVVLVVALVVGALVCAIAALGLQTGDQLDAADEPVGGIAHSG